MKIVLVMTSLFAVLLYTGIDSLNRLVELSQDCPNEAFINKHLCNHCSNLEDGLTFSQHRQVYGSTNLNTVFFGSSKFNRIQRGTEELKCRNETPLRAVQCTLSQSKCVDIGNLCFGEHAISNGHLFYRELECI